MKPTPLSIQSARTVISQTVSPIPTPDSSLSSVLRLVSSFDDLDDGPPPTPRPSLPDWSNVIERVHQAAAHVREVEAQAHEQEIRVRELLERVREDMNTSAERARAAEARAAKLRSHCEALLKAAGERVEAAEERARIAEEWLTRVYDVVDREFRIQPDGKLSAG